MKGRGGFLSAPIVIGGHAHLCECWHAAAILPNFSHQKLFYGLSMALLIVFEADAFLHH